MGLEQHEIVRTALRLLNEVGLDGLTIRRLAQELGVQNPALYWHFENKQQLLDQMARQMLDDAFASLKAPRSGAKWEPWLADVARRYRRVMLAYRDGARVIAGARLLTPERLGSLELALEVLTAAGFDVQTAFAGVLAVFDYTLGATFEAQTEPDVGAVARLSGALQPAKFPLLTKVLTRKTPASASGFDAGLQLVLDGLRAKQTGRTRAAARASNRSTRR